VVDELAYLQILIRREMDLVRAHRPRSRGGKGVKRKEGMLVVGEGWGRRIE